LGEGKFLRQAAPAHQLTFPRALPFTKRKFFLPNEVLCSVRLRHILLTLVISAEQLGDLQANEIETNAEHVYESFDMMNLKEPLLRGIFGLG